MSISVECALGFTSKRGLSSEVALETYAVGFSSGLGASFLAGHFR